MATSIKIDAISLLTVDLCRKYRLFGLKDFCPFFEVVNVGQEPIVRPDHRTQLPVIMVITAMTLECTPPQVLASPDISAMDLLFLHVRVYSVNIGILAMCGKLNEYSHGLNEKLIQIFTCTFHQCICYFRRSHRRRVSSGTLL